MDERIITLTVNGDRHAVAVRPRLLLSELLRERLGLTGTKEGCGTGDCGACTVFVEGRPLNACLTLAVEVDGRQVTTIEGIASSGVTLHPVQQAFVDKGALQCGYCTPGMVMSAVHLLREHPEPDEAAIRKALDGNLCRCTGYNKIVEAIEAASQAEGGGA